MASAPVAQGRHRTATRDRSGRVLERPVEYIDQQSKNVRNTLAWIATEHRPDRLIEGPIRFVLIVMRHRMKSWPKGKWAWTEKPDTDNFSKLKDAFNGILWVDDSQVIEDITCKRIVSDDEPEGFMIKVEEITEDRQCRVW